MKFTPLNFEIENIDFTYNVKFIHLRRDFITYKLMGFKPNIDEKKFLIPFLENLYRYDTISRNFYIYFKDIKNCFIDVDK